MKKFFIFILTFILALSMFVIPANCEKEYFIKDFSYENNVMKGEVIVPEDEVVFARIVMFLSGNYYIEMYLPISSNGEFELPIFAQVEYITVSIVKNIGWEKLTPDDIYDSIGYEINI